MAAEQRMVSFFSPADLTELIQLYSRHPSAVLFAGGTWLLGREQKKIPVLGEQVINIGGIDELTRIHRTERFLEIGAAAPLSLLLEQAKRVLPVCLYRCLTSIGTPAIRNLAGLGGNLSNPEYRMDSFPVLFALEAQVELIGPEGSRRLPIPRLIDSENNLRLKPGELIQRILIPVESFTEELYWKHEHNFWMPETHLSVTAVARMEKGTISEARLVFSAFRRLVMRHRELEAELVGRVPPLSQRETEYLYQELDSFFQAAGPIPRELDRRMLILKALDFLSNLGSEATIPVPGRY
ncbi:MAG: FAD binding domain-containing protein [Spirochaetales bacterium]|nr:FAD binding domain-containing protein [Spirochaetales bacterium]MCF7937078.1 FAD binding domain-containing protein [Spirochaetales bacterium]